MLRTVVMACRGCALLRRASSLSRSSSSFPTISPSGFQTPAAPAAIGSVAAVRGLASVAPSRSEAAEEATTPPTSTATTTTNDSSSPTAAPPAAADASTGAGGSGGGSSAAARLSSRRARIAPIKLTDRAADRIKDLISGRDKVVGVRLGVKRRGCNGLSYTMNYAEEKPKFDEEVNEKGVRVFIDPMALMHIVGTVMDFEETELSSEFTFNNPNAKGKCGCGESFSV